MPTAAKPRKHLCGSRHGGRWTRFRICNPARGLNEDHVLCPSLDAHYRQRKVRTFQGHYSPCPAARAFLWILCYAIWCNALPSRFDGWYSWRQVILKAGNIEMDDLKERVALVTGASRGIGAAIALALAKAGVNIAVNYHTRIDEAERVAERVRALGGRAIAIPADVAVTAAVQQMVSRTQKELGRI